MSSVYRASPAAKSALEATTQYLDYLLSTWLPLSLWQSWSDFGRLVASALLKIPIEGVLPTTNHLESFNRLLKRKYIPLWQRSGSRLRFDFLISILITHILPSIFADRRAQGEYTKWLLERFSTSSNSAEIITSLERRQGTHGRGQVCWWRDDVQRDTDAQGLLQRRCLRDITMHANNNGYESGCVSSSRVGIAYRLHLQRDGYGSCDCPDFINRGGACKHLRAFRLVIEGWVQSGLIHPFIYPTTFFAATRTRSTFLQTDGNPPDIPFHPPDANVGLSAVDTLLTLRMFVSQSGPPEEFQNELDEDITLDDRSIHSDSSESSFSATDLLHLVRSVSL